jgi:DNA-binding transcriptional regulator YdaS (Cro superfamily)
VDPRDSGVFRLASVGSYLDALSAITDEMSLKERSNLIFLDRCLHEHWGLGQNVILNWCPDDDGITLLVIPHYGVAEYSGPAAAGSLPAADRPASARPKQDFFQTLLSGRRCLTPLQMSKVAKLLGVEPTHVSLREPLKNAEAQNEIVEKMVKRYSITYVPNRGVAVFDIVGFSLLSPFEQMMQLNSLSYSLNSAQSKLLAKRIGVDFARTTTGDGFYIWNRDLTLEGNVSLYHFMQLVLADNAIAHKKAGHNTVPRLRACFHVGSSYEFHQSEGLNPTLYSYIVGDVTVELARMIERALPGQILVGEFRAEMPVADGAAAGPATVDSVDFVELATRTVERLAGLELSGERVDAIRCYLTGTRLTNGEFTVRRITINDKHGISRRVYNAKVNLYRQNAEPILLGIEDRVLEPSNMPADGSEHLLHPLQPLHA